VKAPNVPARSGFSLPEVLVALVLGLFLAHLGLESLSRLQAARARIAARTDALVALRVGRHVLRSELRHGVAGSDWSVDGDSVWIRAFRGAAVVCESAPSSASLTVSYSGDRVPDPTKDSLVLFDATGASEVRALVGTAAATTPCDGPGRAARWFLDRGASPGAVVAKLFEHGSYHLTDAALRYRRGASGRQPLTPEVWSAATGWTVSGNRVGVMLVPRDRAAGPAFGGFLAWTNPR
jgi:prepilin-type N-terminal cleavage/methylation domain-containing protein